MIDLRVVTPFSAKYYIITNTIYTCITIYVFFLRKTKENIDLWIIVTLPFRCLIHIYFCRRFIFVYQKSSKQTFKTGFWVQNHLLNLCSSAVNSQRLLCNKKLVWNVRIKAFLYSKNNSTILTQQGCFCFLLQ